MITRGIAAFLGTFSLVNSVGGLLVPDFDANIWWINTAPLPTWTGNLLLAFAGVALLSHAFGFLSNSATRRAAVAILGLVAGFTLANCIEFFALTSRAAIRPWVPVPLSALISTAVIWITVEIRRGPISTPRRSALAAVAALAALVVAFPLAQMFFFGTTDYRRSADVAVVFGARTYADGTASQALADRVRTAVDLYHDGLVDRLLFSGGPGDGPTSEPQAMRRIAVSHGVPDKAILLDEAGLNTEATVNNTSSAFSMLGVRRVLVVSHAYHLPRVKLAYQRAGWDVRTVPAHQSRRLRNEPVFIAREVVALWAYYLRPLV